MAAETLTYQGINRSITDYAGSRACEELINLRPTASGLIPLRPFSVKFSDRQFDRVFRHQITGYDNFIAVRHDSSSVEVALLSSGGTVLQVLFTVEVTGTSEQKAAKIQNIIANVHCASVDDLVLFSICDRTDGIYMNRAFRWDSPITFYKEVEANVPAFDVTINDGTGTVLGKGKVRVVQPSDVTRVEIAENVRSALNAMQEEDPELCVGPTIIAVALKTKDGNTFWTDKWNVYDPVTKFGNSYPPTVYSGTNWWGKTVYGATYFDAYFEAHDVGYDVQRQDVYTDEPLLMLTGTKVTVTIGALDGNPSHSSYPNYWNKNTSMIQSVEIYASKPIPYVDPESAYDGMDPFGMPTLLDKRDYSKMELDGQPLYHQASIPMDSLLDGQQTVTLKFGGNIQITNETLRVDAGATTRYGDMLAYNARFHYYASVARTVVGKPSFSGLTAHGHSSATDTTYIFVKHQDESGTRLFYMGYITTGGGFCMADLTIAPSTDIKEVILYSKYTRYVEYEVAMYCEGICRMNPSPAYNYSFGTTSDWTVNHGSGTKSAYEALITANAGSTVTTVEPEAINVTEQYNPFVFRVEHSYTAPGRITDLVPQQFVVTDATYGREPVAVFTERGIYALIQGSGDILYAWFDQISPMVANGRAVPTEMGIFFISGGALWLCAGHRTTLVSDALMAGPHKYVRSADSSTSYVKIAGTGGLVPMSDYVSSVDFETFVAGGRLSYNRFRQEVYVSNATYGYTYVLSLKYRQWFKLGDTVWQDEPASTIVSRPGATAGRVDVLNLGTEEDGRVSIHIQSRPFSMGYQYSHVHRIVSMVSASLSSTYGDVLVAHLYGSDDLRNWKLLAYARRNGTNPATQISQIRTPSAARSWRYYTVCLTGKVYAGMEDNTDIGPFIVDYDPVVRRIG